MSTTVLEALPGKFDIKRHSPSILYVALICQNHCRNIYTHLHFVIFGNTRYVLKPTNGKIKSQMQRLV